MPVYHFTLHAYGTWMPDHPRGYVRLGEGMQKPDPFTADEYRARAGGDATCFNKSVQCAMTRAADGACVHREMRLYAAAFDRTHAHFLVSWKDFAKAEDVIHSFKNGISFELRTLVDPPAVRWFTRGGSYRWVRGRAHFDYLVNKYFPDHPGVFWRAGWPFPNKDRGLPPRG